MYPDIAINSQIAKMPYTITASTKNKLDEIIELVKDGLQLMGATKIISKGESRDVTINMLLTSQSFINKVEKIESDFQKNYTNLDKYPKAKKRKFN